MCKRVIKNQITHQFSSRYLEHVKHSREIHMWLKAMFWARELTGSYFLAVSFGDV
jgi:hypothetical protein